MCLPHFHSAAGNLAGGLVLVHLVFIHLVGGLHLVHFVHLVGLFHLLCGLCVFLVHLVHFVLRHLVLGEGGGRDCHSCREKYCEIVLHFALRESNSLAEK
jgi:hypothetical protein